MLCRIFFSPFFRINGLEGSSKAMGLGWRLRSKPFVCTTGRLVASNLDPQAGDYLRLPTRVPSQGDSLMVLLTNSLPFRH